MLRERRQVFAWVPALAFVASVSANTRAQDASSPAKSATAYASGEGTITEGPPPAAITYLQYGVAFTAELAAAQGKFCLDPALNCVLGSGGGITGRAGWRSAGAWYFGGAYELSKQDPTKLLRLAILQQVRFESRYYISTGRDTQPFATGGLGLAGYGNEFSISTWGPSAFIGAGVETQVSSGPVVSVALGYRPMYLQSFDVSGTTHGPGFAHMVSFDITLEAKDPL